MLSFSTANDTILQKQFTNRHNRQVVRQSILYFDLFFTCNIYFVLRTKPPPLDRKTRHVSPPILCKQLFLEYA